MNQKKAKALKKIVKNWNLPKRVYRKCKRMYARRGGVAVLEHLVLESQARDTRLKERGY